MHALKFDFGKRGPSLFKEPVLTRQFTVFRAVDDLWDNLNYRRLVRYYVHIENVSFHSVAVIAGNVINLRMTITNEKCTEGEPSESFLQKLKEGVTIVFK